MKKILAFLVVAVAMFAGPLRVVQTQDTQLQFVADEILIQFRQGATAAERADARRWVGGARRRLIRRNGTGELEIATTRGRSVEDAAAVLRLHPAVDYAEPNWIYTHQATSDDPYYIDGSLWGMLGDTTAPANQFGSQAGEAWRAENVGSASIYVGVIDEGIDLNHPDLASNIWTNPFDPVDGVDNDGNGYVDDVHGWNFSQNNNSIYDGSPSDSTTDSHGTHVSGIIGAVGGNGIGVAGVNWNVTMISAKFLGPSGGTTADAIRAIDYITDLKTRHGLNIVATNNSWGGGGYSQALHDAIIRAANAGILFVAAAGNGNFFGLGLNNDTTPYYPSSYNTAAGYADPACRQLRRGHRGRFNHEHRREIDFFQLRQDNGRSRSAGERYMVDDAQQWIQVVQRHLDGRRSRDRSSSPVRLSESSRDGVRHQERPPCLGSGHANRVAQQHHRDERAAQHRLLRRTATAATAGKSAERSQRSGRVLQSDRSDLGR